MTTYFYGIKHDDVLELTRDMALSDGEFRPYLFWLGKEAAEEPWRKRPSPYAQWYPMENYSVNPFAGAIMNVPHDWDIRQLMLQQNNCLLSSQLLGIRF